MKRKIALFAALALLFSLAGTISTAKAQTEPDTLVVGHTTMLSGNFLSEHFGNNTADIDVRSLLHEYPLVTWSNAGEYKVNRTVISRLETDTNADGSKTYTITLHSGLKYSDGSAVTAKDYVFSFLVMASPQMAELSGVAQNRQYIQGYRNFQTGSASSLSGIRLVDDRTFSIQISGDYLPHYFELSYINNTPLPYHVIIPGSDIADDGSGAYISGAFTADTLRETLLNEATGYVSHPAVTSGPYRLVRYDAQAHVAEFELNPYYKGNYEGQRPSIRRQIGRAHV